MENLSSEGNIGRR